MAEKSILGNAFLITAIAGFLFWPAWIVTGIVILLQIGGNSSASHTAPKANALRLAPRRLPTSSGLASTSKTAQTAHVSALPAGKQTYAREPRQKGAANSQSKVFAWPEVKGAREPMKVDQRPMQSMPEPDANSTRVLPTANLTKNRIADMVRERRIEQLIHFTRCENVAIILNRGLLSVSSLEMERVEAIRNDAFRLDGKLDALCLSVSFPNHRMFYKYRRERQTTDWAVLRLRPSILWELDCLFYEMNAADHRMRNRLKSELQGPESFATLFGDVGGARSPRLHPSFPTNVQAEVLVTVPIDPTYIMSVAFETHESHRRWTHLTKNVDVTIEGQGTGLFGSRDRILAN